MGTLPNVSSYCCAWGVFSQGPVSDSKITASAGNKFELLVQSVTDYAIFMLDPDGRVTSWNAGAQRFKGYQADEIIGQHFSRFYTPEDREKEVPRKRWRRLFARGALRPRAGGSAKMGAAFGPMSSSIRFGTLRVSSSVSRRSRETLPSARPLRRNFVEARSDFPCWSRV